MEKPYTVKEASQTPGAHVKDPAETGQAREDTLRQDRRWQAQAPESENKHIPEPHKERKIISYARFRLTEG